MATDNSVYVDISDTGKFVLHQFKDFVGGSTTKRIHWNGKTDYATNVAPVYLQIYNQNTTTWETVVTNNTAATGTDFDLTYDIPDLTNYKDGSSLLSSRVWQSGK